MSLSNIGTKTFKVGTKIIKIFKKFCNIGIKFANGFEKVSSKLPGVYILADVDFKYTGKGIKVRTRGRRSKRQRFRGSEPDVAILEFDIPISGPGERAAADLAIRVAEQAVLSLAFGGVNSSGTLNAINSVSGGFENIDEVVDAVKRICPQGRLKK